MDAKEARELALKVENLKVQKQYKSIHEQILILAKDGYFYLNYYDTILPQVEKKLVEEGYSIKDNSSQNINTLVIISW